MSKPSAHQFAQAVSEVMAMDRTPELVMLVMRLSRALKKECPQHEMPELAMDYLKRWNLVPSPLREGSGK